MILRPRAKLALVALMFLIALALVGAAAATHKAGPLFFMWIPLLAVAWLLARPETPQEAEALRVDAGRARAGDVTSGGAVPSEPGAESRGSADLAEEDGAAEPAQEDGAEP